MVIEMKVEVVEQVVRAFKKLKAGTPQENYSDDEILAYAGMYFVQQVEKDGPVKNLSEAKVMT